MYLRLERLVEDHVARVVLDVLPAGVAVTGAEGASREEPANNGVPTPRSDTTAKPPPRSSPQPPQLPRPAEAVLASPPPHRPTGRTSKGT